MISTRSQKLKPTCSRIVLLVATLCLLAPTPACTSNDPQEISKEEKLALYLELSLRYYTLGDLDRAQDQVQRGLELDPANERLLLVLGNIHQLRGTTRDILQAEQIFRNHPAKDDYRVNLGLAQALERKGVIYDESADQILAGRIYTDAADPKARAAQLAADSEKCLDEANKYYFRTLELHAGELGATSGLVRVTALLGQDTESIDWGQKLIKLLKNSTRIRHLELEDPALDAARERELRDAIDANQQMVTKVRLHISDLYDKLDRQQEAVDELGTIIDEDPERAVAFSRRAQLYFDLGQYQRAVDSIEAFLKLSSDLPFDDADIRQAYSLMRQCRAALREAGTPPSR